ncbi:NlpC/P60 family protein [Flaviflexus salsibiostraticola]|uniref:NlpC/P60 family protein n=2 Tax=Flaviflexus salsibiostraticola TaxID=1282737 RepID=A0A3S8ZAQ1_9ACTO|nr:NlpC/P60 family protein [Flaviflexus salsibiostraticola]
MSNRRGRHVAPKVRPSSAFTVAAVSAAFGMTATAAVAAPETEAVAKTVSLAAPQAPAVIGVELPEEAAVELAPISVTSEAAPEPVVEEAPVEVEAEVPAAPAAAPAPAEAAPQAAAAPAQTQAAPQVAAPAPAPAVSSGNQSVVAIARQYVGAPYVYGGTTPAGWDCSGFTSYVFAQAGISLPRSSSAQLYAGRTIPASQAQPGDLVWWPGHIGIYSGNGMHIAARNPSSGTYEGPVYGTPTYVRVGG